MSESRPNKIQTPGSDRVCPWQHVYLLDNFLRPLLHNPQKMFAPYVTPGMKALDIGCGRGFASLGLAKLVGETGTVVAADLQPEMLEMVSRRATKANLVDRIRIHQCSTTSTGLNELFGFILAFWMAHETPDPNGFLKEILGLLNPGGHFYLIEPKMHVSAGAFKDYVSQAESTGFVLKEIPSVRMSRGAVLIRPNSHEYSGNNIQP